MDIEPQDAAAARKAGYMTGQVLIAMPQLRDSFFARTIVYIGSHNEEGAMGIVLNKPLPSLTFGELLMQLEIEAGTEELRDSRVHFGGPVDTARGFVLHSPEYDRDGTVTIDKDVSLTTTVEVLRDIAEEKGPQKSFVALGYSGWTAGQLDQEILSNGWLSVDPDPDLLFGEDLDSKWKKAMDKLGIDIDRLTVESGQA